MLHRKDLILIFTMFLFKSTVLAFTYPLIAISNDTISDSISANEVALFDLINTMRIRNNLPVIPLSSDLCKVARTHIDDLIVSKPQVKGCGLHSWSNLGNWTPCCDFKNLSGIQCMKSKPKEITGYPGFGYELIYWGDETATPDDAAALWQQVDASSNMILGKGRWKGFQWKAIGVGIKEGYAVLWFGDKTERIQKVKPVVSRKVVSQNTKNPELQSLETVAPDTVAFTQNLSSPSKTGETSIFKSETVTWYYLIVSSVKASASAKSELMRVKSKGYPQAVILEEDALYRIAILWFDTEEKAKKKVDELKNTFPGIWIFKK